MQSKPPGQREFNHDPFLQSRRRTHAGAVSVDEIERISALASPAPGSSYSRVVEPVLLGVFCAAQLVWAFDKVARILLG